MLPQEKISCTEARARGLKRYYTGKPCPRNHVSERYLSGGCVRCVSWLGSLGRYPLSPLNCYDCGDELSRRPGGGKQNKRCHNCRRIRRNVNQNKRNAASPERRRYDRLKRYGITSAEYKTMLAFQGGVYAICHQPETRKTNNKVQALSVDHCHKTGKYRGLLCNRHNRLLGLAQDNSSILRAAADYLDGFSFAQLYTGEE